MKSCFAHRRTRNPKGFTLIELLVVIAIIAILAAILFPVFAKAREKAYQNACISNQRQLSVGIMTYAQDHDETFPLPKDWVDACGLSTDTKVFDCPSSGKKGNPGEPDYGMNAFVYDVDPQTGGVVGAAVGNMDDPTQVELTTDISKQTEAGSNDADLNLRKLQDQFINPFPKTYTCNGYWNANGDIRHSGGAVCSYADGHVALVKSSELANGTSGYSLPRGHGRVFIDFSQCKDQADAYARLQSAFALGVSHGCFTGCTWNNVTKTLDMNGAIPGGGNSEPGAMLGVTSDAEAYHDVNCWMDHGGNRMKFMVEGTIDDGVKVEFGPIEKMWNSVACPWSATAVPCAPGAAGDPDNNAQCDEKAFVLDTQNNFLQVGQLYAYGIYPAGIYANYTTKTFTALTSEAGQRVSIPAQSSKIRIEANINWGADAYAAPFPTDPANKWSFYTYYGTPQPNRSSWAQELTNTASVKFTNLAPSPGAASASGKWHMMRGMTDYERKLFVRGAGSMHISKILYSAGSN